MFSVFSFLRFKHERVRRVPNSLPRLERVGDHSLRYGGIRGAGGFLSGQKVKDWKHIFLYGKNHICGKVSVRPIGLRPFGGDTKAKRAERNPVNGYFRLLFVT